MNENILQCDMIMNEKMNYSTEYMYQYVNMINK